MPVEFALWRIDSGVTKVPFQPLAEEKRLEDILEQDISVLGLDVLLVIGRQVPTDYGGRIDLLAVDSQGVLHAIELKRDKTPRDVVAQTLDYGSWVTKLLIAAQFREVGAVRTVEWAEWGRRRRIDRGTGTRGSASAPRG